jgi:hypothetical protein
MEQRFWQTLWLYQPRAWFLIQNSNVIKGLLPNKRQPLGLSGQITDIKWYFINCISQWQNVWKWVSCGTNHKISTNQQIRKNEEYLEHDLPRGRKVQIDWHNSFLPEDSVQLPCNNNQFEKLCFCERWVVISERSCEVNINQCWVILWLFNVEMN